MLDQSTTESCVGTPVIYLDGFLTKQWLSGVVDRNEDEDGAIGIEGTDKRNTAGYEKSACSPDVYAVPSAALRGEMPPDQLEVHLNSAPVFHPDYEPDIAVKQKHIREIMNSLDMILSNYVPPETDCQQ